MTFERSCDGCSWASARRIARDLEVSRNTVAHYRQAATHGLLTGPLPEPARLAALLAAPPGERPAQEQSLVEPFREQVLAWHAKDVEGQAIWQLLVEQHGFEGSYSSVKRFAPRGAADPARDAAPRSRPGGGSASRLRLRRPVSGSRVRTGCDAPGRSS